MKALFDEGNDYLDSFCPFALRVIPKDTSWTAFAIQDELRKVFDLKMPIHVLSIILKRTEKKKYVEKLKDTYKLTDYGCEYVSKMETDKEVERRLNKLWLSIQDYCAGKKVTLTNQQIRNLLTYFINRNIDYFSQYINPATKPQQTPKVNDSNERHLLEYFEVADKQEPDNYKTLEDLVMGSIISTLLHTQTAEDLENLENTQFASCTLFLDTNFVFSIMGLHSEEFNEAARELYDMLKKHKFSLKIFSFTTEEISRVINAYCTEGYRYPTGLRVYTIHSSLRRKGWKETDAREFVMYLEKNLQEKGIAVEWVKNSALEDYKAAEEARKGIRRFKPEQPIPNQNHDLMAIEEIKERRGRPITRLEDSKDLFLTSDARLSKFNFETYHKKTRTISEVMLDRLLANILWLKNPSTELSLKAIIASHSRDLFVKRNVWNKFYEVLQNLKQTGKTTEDKIATLFLNNYIEDCLLSIDNPDDITPELGLDLIEKAKKKQEADFGKLEQEIDKLQKLGDEKEEELAIKKAELERSKEELKKEKEFAQTLIQNAAETARAETNKEWLQKVKKIKTEIGNKAERTASLISNVIRASAILVYLSVLTYAYFSGVPLTVLSFIISAVGFGGLFGIWKVAGRARPLLFNYVYKRMLSTSKLKKLDSVEE
jgi:tellurite resistance protein